MSGFAGVFMRTGEPADAIAVSQMAARTPYRSRDGAWSFADGCFAAARQLTSYSNDSRTEQGPIRDRSGRYVMFFDGRLDNGLLLQRALRSPLDQPSDAHLALAAWDAWGESAPDKLLGDFAFVLWDAHEHRVFCARDPLGIRPLFYCLTDRAFVFGSEVRQLLAHPLVPCAPDETMIAGLLSASLGRVADHTLYRAIRRLPHGHTLRVDVGAAQVNRYWRVDLGRELQLSNDAEYSEAFREVFTKAVTARVCSAGKVGSYLSGGLDSSTVAVTAREVMCADGTLKTFSLIFPGHAAADEQEYSRAVVDCARVDAEWLQPTGITRAIADDQVSTRRELPDFPHDFAGDTVRGAMSADDIHVALTGTGGDVGLSGSHYHYADLLRRGELRGFWRRYVDVAREPAMGWMSADILRCAVWPLLPAAVRHLVRPVARRANRAGAPSWIEPAFAARTGRFEQAPLRMIPPGQLARTDVHDAFDNGWVHMALDMYQRGSLVRGIDDRHPFLDRRVVEFALALPDDQRWQSGRTRYVLRNAMAGRLPESVRQRPDAGKGDFSHLYLRALRAIGGRTFFSDNMEIAQGGWLVPSRARELYDRMHAQHAREDAAYGDSAFWLWSIAAVEMWHQGVFGPRAGRMTWSGPIEALNPHAREGAHPANRIAAPC